MQSLSCLFSYINIYVWVSNEINCLCSVSEIQIFSKFSLQRWTIIRILERHIENTELLALQWLYYSVSLKRVSIWSCFSKFNIMAVEVSDQTEKIHFLAWEAFQFPLLIISVAPHYNGFLLNNTSQLFCTSFQ